MPHTAQTPAARAAVLMQDAVMRLYVQGIIGRDTTLGTVLEQMQGQAANAAPTLVEVYANSLGGSVSEGDAIAHTLRGIPARKVGRIQGQCASITTHIMMECDWIEMTSGSTWLVHEGRGPGGTVDEMRNSIRLVEEANEMMAQRLFPRVARKGKTMEQLRALMKEDRWMGAKEALEWGFIDAISDLEASAFAAPEPHTQPTPSKPTPNMNFVLRLATLLALAASATEEEVFAHVAGLQKSKATLETDLTALKAEVEKERAAGLEARVTALVDAAVKEGKLAEAQRAPFIALAKADYANTKAVIEAMAGTDAPAANHPAPHLLVGQAAANAAAHAGVKTPTPAAVAAVAPAELTAEERAYTLEAWIEKNPARLSALAQANPKWHSALAEADVAEQRAKLAGPIS